jgi:hypothetical protein
VCTRLGHQRNNVVGQMSSGRRWRAAQGATLRLVLADVAADGVGVDGLADEESSLSPALRRMATPLPVSGRGVRGMG